jgi:hypothetical protein
MKKWNNLQCVHSIYRTKIVDTEESISIHQSEFLHNILKASVNERCLTKSSFKPKPSFWLSYFVHTNSDDKMDDEINLCHRLN